MLDPGRIRSLIEQELAVDRVADDVTARLLGERGEELCTGIVSTRQAGIFSGEAVVAAFPLRAGCLVKEGEAISPGQPVVELEASAAACLSHERTLLNLLSHLCGVASLTQRFVEAVQPLPVKILATRKTLPGLRDLQLQAVRAGGGHVHRRSLSDGILIKDNHQSFTDARLLITTARHIRSPLHRIEIEVQNMQQLETALACDPDVVMLDNFDLAQLRIAVARIARRCEVEVSGGVSLQTVREIAETGVQYISVGQLTHSASALDLTLDIGT